MSDTTIMIERHLVGLQAGDARARENLIAVAQHRLRRLTLRMFHQDDRLGRWLDADDVFQNAALRLHHALSQVKPTTAREFFGLAATMMRRELIDLSRSYYGRRGSRGGDDPPAIPENSPANAAQFSAMGTDSVQPQDPGDTQTTTDPSKLAQWTEFHEQVAALPDKEREVVELLFYQELSQVEAAEVLQVDPSTVKRRWREARLLLADSLTSLLAR